MGLNIQRESAWENVFWIFLNAKCLKNNLQTSSTASPHPVHRSDSYPLCRWSAWSQSLPRSAARVTTTLYGVCREERLWGLGLVCVPTHTGFVFVWFFIWEKNVVMISTTTHSPPPNRFIPITETLRENLLCVTKKYVFSLCYRPWIASRAPLSPGGQLSSFMICISLPYTEPSEKLSEPAEWWELKVASKKSPFSSSLCTEAALPESESQIWFKIYTSKEHQHKYTQSLFFSPFPRPFLAREPLFCLI